MERLGNLPMRSQTDPVKATPTETTPTKGVGSTSVPDIIQTTEEDDRNDKVWSLQIIMIHAYA